MEMNNEKAGISAEMTATDTKMLHQVGFAQCAFIAGQAVMLPELGGLGAVLAASCAAMPWLVPTFKRRPELAVSMVVSTLALSPVFGWLCATLVERVPLIGG